MDSISKLSSYSPCLSPFSEEGGTIKAKPDSLIKKERLQNPVVQLPIVSAMIKRFSVHNISEVDSVSVFILN